MTPLASALFRVVDLETTGTDPAEHGVCEFAAVTTNLTGNVHQVSTLCNPGHAIPPEAQGVHHLSDEDVAEAPREFPWGLNKSLPRCHVNVAHNAEFEAGFLPRMKPWLCTMRMAKRLFPDLPSYGNQALRYRFKLQVPEAEGLMPHRALADCYVTAALLRHLLANLPADAPGTVEELIPWCAAPILLTTCTMKKHKGMPWEQVAAEDRGYLWWIVDKMEDPDPDVVYTARYYLEKR